MAATVGYIGLGDIGAPMAGRILDGGFELVVWNRTPQKMQPLLDKGAKAAASPADMGARCDMVFVCVDSAKAVEQVVFGPDGVAAGARVRLVIDNSTIHPHQTIALAERLRSEAGKAWLDVPVSGGPVGAEAGTLAAFVGGAAEDLAFARDAIATFSGQITHMGGQGAGQATKACNQVINFGTMMAVSEALSLAQRFGLDSDLLPQAIAGGFADSNILREYARANAIGRDVSLARVMNSFVDYYQGRVDASYAGKMDMALKDLGMALDMGRDVGSPMPITNLFDNVVRVLHYQQPNQNR